MSKNIKTISIVLENCEYYDFNPKDVDIELIGLKKHILDGRVYNCAEECIIRIQKGAKVLNPVEEWQTEQWGDRIHKDITQVQSDGETYFVKWGEGEYENEYETDIKDDPLWNIYIISSVRNKIEDFEC